MMSLGAVIYLIARVVPRVTEIEAPTKEPGFFDKLLKKISLEKVDAVLSGLLEKLLRKFKVVILRLDNLVSKHLHRVKSSGSDSMAGVKPALFENTPLVEPVEKKENLDNSEET